MLVRYGQRTKWRRSRSGFTRRKWVSLIILAMSSPSKLSLYIYRKSTFKECFWMKGTLSCTDRDSKTKNSFYSQGVHNLTEGTSLWRHIIRLLNAKWGLKRHNRFWARQLGTLCRTNDFGRGSGEWVELNLENKITGHCSLRDWRFT